ncbi:unnamed protein product [Cylicocyclus nassatus]|uniref:MARVEL domain-containing protein n=1 Tax=Cylicocyclus nassatus TaxID=53992 RepID=A0AA36H9C4_CYLNA|nr:unnamed protein product [Cylicocyclus nassatus]
MPLYVSRFTEFPYFFKVLTVFFSLATLISLTGAPLLPGGSSLIWFTVIIALLIDLAIIAILLFELERIEIPVRGLSHSSLECFTSLMLSIFYFICIWLCVNGEEFSGSSWFYLAAFSCFANFIIYAVDFAVYLRQWMAEQRAARSDPSGVYDFPSYGSP